MFNIFQIFFFVEQHLGGWRRMVGPSICVRIRVNIIFNMIWTIPNKWKIWFYWKIQFNEITFMCMLVSRARCHTTRLAFSKHAVYTISQLTSFWNMCAMSSTVLCVVKEYGLYRTAAVSVVTFIFCSTLFPPKLELAHVVSLLCNVTFQAYRFWASGCFYRYLAQHFCLIKTWIITSKISFKV